MQEQNSFIVHYIENNFVFPKLLILWNSSLGKAFVFVLLVYLSENWWQSER